MLEQAILVKDAAGLTDPNPVHWRHIFSQLEANFPNDSIEWVKRARWLGPCNVPWSRVDDDDEDKWAASHQPEAVNRFARGIASGKGNTAPSILVQEPGKDRAFIVDGHHRALARKKLGKPVLAYVGNIDPRDREAAEQTHSSQIHSGSDRANKSAQTPELEATPDLLGTHGLWHTPDRHVGHPQKRPNDIEHIAHALMRDQGMGEQQAIATAINAVKRWAKGDLHWGRGKVTPEVQAASQRALAEWEHLKETHH
jgi:ParB/Sulfiredoxin domain